MLATLELPSLMLGKHLTICEDSHTASVFTHLLHLPTEVFWAILRNACHTLSLPKNPGELLDVHPWPRWDATGTGNSHSVVPDLFIRFADFDLIIEAKRGDDGMQDPDQWQRELIAYGNEYGEKDRSVRMIALGGILGTEDETITHQWTAQGDSGTSRELVCPVHMCRWRSLLHQCQQVRRELERLEYPTSQTAAARRVLLDLIDLFAWHGYSTGSWFRDLEFARYRLPSSVDAHLRLFHDRSRQLSAA